MANGEIVMMLRISLSIVSLKTMANGHDAERKIIFSSECRAREQWHADGEVVMMLRE